MLQPRSGRDRGGINLVQVTLLLAAVAVGYFGYIYVPVVLDHFGMKKAVRVGCNVAYANRSVEAVKKSIMRSYKELDMKDEYLDQNTGKIAKTPTPFSDDDIQVDLSRSPPQVTVTVKYQRRVVWPFTNDEKTVDYEYTHTEPLDDIKW